MNLPRPFMRLAPKSIYESIGFLRDKLRNNSLSVLAWCVIWFSWTRRIDAQGWYDEYSVLANMSSLNEVHFGESFNWLQSMPFGYFYLGKFFVNFDLAGIYGLRLISAICVFVSAVILTEMAKSLNKNIKAILILTLCLNPVISTYAIAVKPYALEILFGVIAFRLIVARRAKTFFVIVFLSLPFGSTLAVFNGSLILFALINNKSKKYTFLAGLYFLSVLFASKFTSEETREVMSISWFGPASSDFIQNFKSSIGNLLWFPISGLGILPEMGSTGSTYLASALIMLIVLSTIYFSKIKTPGRYIFFICLGAAVFLQTIQLLPAAGRLLLPLAQLIWLELFLAVYSTKKYLLRVSLLVITSFIVVSQTFFPSTEYSLGEEVDSIRSVVSSESMIYSVQDFAPLIQYTSNVYGANLSPNLLIQNPNTREVEACSKVTLPRGVFLILNRPLQGENVRNVQLIKKYDFSLYRVQQQFDIIAAQDSKLPLNCAFRFGNPGIPMN